MEKKEKYILISVVLLTFIFIGIFYFSIKKTLESKTYEILNDTLLVKEEYESINKTKKEVIIDVDSNIFNISLEDAINLISSERAFIFVANKNCETSRSIIEVLLATSTIYDEKIYYLDVLNDEAQYELLGTNVSLTKESSEEYKNFTNLFLDKIDNFIFKEDEKEIKTKYKKLITPSLIVIKNSAVYSVISFDKEDASDIKKLFDLFESVLKDEFDEE